MNSLRLLAVFLLGAILGGTGAAILVGKKAGEFYQDQYMNSVMDQANVALHVRAGKGEKLLKTIETNMPEYAVAIDKSFREHSQAVDALWMIKAYYQRSGQPVPEKIKNILNALPAKPPTACAARLKALDAAIKSASKP